MAKPSTLDRAHTIARSNAAKTRSLARRQGLAMEAMALSRPEIKNAAEAEAAYARADAWARSVKGTAYGGTEPVLEELDKSRVAEALDPRVMARLHGKEAAR